MCNLLVLWDVDGTLVDSGDIGRDAFRMAYREMFDRELPDFGMLAGQTDRAISREVLALAGIFDACAQTSAFIARLRALSPSLAESAASRVRALPGAAQAIAAVAALADVGEPECLVVQSLLTGNVREFAEVKLGPFGLLTHLDLDVGAYGCEDEIRAGLVPIARRNAAEAYQRDFGGDDTVLVGDTPMDVAAALDTGAKAVAVATGPYSAAELADAGAHIVLPDLVDTCRLISAILS